VPLIALLVLLAAQAPDSVEGKPQGLSLGKAGAELSPSPMQEWRVEGVLALNATSPASNVETTVAPWFGLRAGTLAPARDAASMGFDGALYAGTVSEGTPQVKTSRTLAFVEGRGLFAPMRVSSTFSALVPYGFLGASLGGGVVEVRAFDEARFRPLFTWATRAGLGAELQVHSLMTRLELGVGLRDLRFELTSALSLGIAF
jgi:hypothetical protein